MLSDQYKVRIGFGNNKGNTIKVVLEQEQQKIERLNRKKSSCSNPKIIFKSVQQISLSPFTEMIYQKRDPTVVAQLLRVHQNKEIKKILNKSKKDTVSLQNDLNLIANFAQNLQIDQFMNSTGCRSEAECKKYLNKYNNLTQAVKTFKEHSKIIDDFMKMNKCSRQDAISYLEPNQYKIDLFK